MTGQNVWQSASEKTFANSNDYFLVKNPTRTNTEKMSLTTLTSIADSIRAAKDDTIAYYAGFNSSYQYATDETTNTLKSANFVAAGKTVSLKNALFILDSVLYYQGGIQLWDRGTGTYGVEQYASRDSAIGTRSVAMGRYTIAEATTSFSHGRYSVSDLISARAFSSGKIMDKYGSNQYMEIVVMMTTTTNVADTLCIGNTAGQYILIPNDCVVNFTVSVSAVQQAGAAGTIGDAYGITLGGMIKNDAGTTSLLAGSCDTLMLSNTAAFGGGATVEADNTNDAIYVKVTGETNKTIYWTATVKMTMTGFRNFDNGY